MLKTGKLLGLLVLFKQYGGYSRHGVPVLVAGVGSHFFFGKSIFTSWLFLVNFFIFSIVRDVTRWLSGTCIRTTDCH